MHRKWIAAFIAAAALSGSALGGPAHAETNDVSPCVPANDVPTSNADTQWSVRACDVPDFDQRRITATNLGQPTPISVEGLDGNGECHCVLTSIADLYAKAHAQLDNTGGFETFDWNGRGALPAAPIGPTYDTSTYSASELAAYTGATRVIDTFGDVADVSWGQDDAHQDCGTSWFNFYSRLDQAAETFGETVDDYTFAANGIDAQSAADMARALADGAGVAFAYGYYTNVNTSGAVHTSTARDGGHANAIVGVSRSGNTFTFETSDPASSAESSEDRVRQSQFARTTWSATRRQLKVGDDKAYTLFNLEGTNRYVDSWLQFTTPKVILRPIDRRKILYRKYVPIPDPPRPTASEYTFPGPVLDATFDLTSRRLLAVVAGRRGPGLYAADAFTGVVKRVRAALPQGTDRIAALTEGSVAVLGGSVVRVIDRGGRTLASRTVAGGAADVAFNPQSAGVAVLRGDGRRVVDYSPVLQVRRTRVIAVPRGAGAPTRNARLSVAANGSIQATRAPAGRERIATQSIATPTGGTLQLRGGQATLLDRAGRANATRRVTGLRGASLLDLAIGGSKADPPGDDSLRDLVDQRLDPPPAGYEEFSR